MTGILKKGFRLFRFVFAELKARSAIAMQAQVERRLSALSMQLTVFYVRLRLDNVRLAGRFGLAAAGGFADP